MAKIDKNIPSMRSGGVVAPQRGVEATPMVQDIRPPAGRGFKSLPHPAALQALIDRAVAALQRGIFWDRGSIINIVV